MSEKHYKIVDNLRSRMKEKGIDVYIIPSDDFHKSEYVGDYFKTREYVTGFTGSAGTAVISEDKAYLWTDGRYFIQAAKELSDTPFSLMKSGEKSVPTLMEYIGENFAGRTIGFDGRVFSYSEGKAYAQIGKIVCDRDLVDDLWEDRPALLCEPAYFLDEEFTGESIESKLSRCRKEMKKQGANVQILTALDDICWMLNLRGDDVHYSNLILAYGMLYENHMVLYCDHRHFTPAMEAVFVNKNIELRSYEAIYEDVKALNENTTLLLNKDEINYILYKNIPENIRIINALSPQSAFKCIKNETEMKNIRKAQLKDAVVHVRFMKWLKENYKSGEITELSAEAKMEELRRKEPDYIAPSFAPICAYGEHAALPHYSSSEDTDVVLREGNVFLTDTGGGYYQGSTDITRTYALGEIPEYIKEHFTLTVMANLRLSDAVFLEGCCGQNLDYVAREPFWRRGLNYNHGTGHGVGYLLNVHEGTAAFRQKINGMVNTPLQEGMLITDEPGIYIENSHGIRLENNLLVRKGEVCECGQFMYFENLTFIPFDLDAIKTDMLEERDKKLLNDYHRKVCLVLSPFLTVEEKEWLKKYTKAV